MNKKESSSKEEILKDLELLYERVVEILSKKDEIIEKQEQLLEIRQTIISDYGNIINEQESMYKGQIKKLKYLSIILTISFTISLILNFIS